MFKIVVESGPDAGQAFISPESIEGGFTFKVGRDANNDICLKMDFISSLHGEFVFHRNQLFFRDMRSTNGSTLVRDAARRPLDEEHGLAVQLRDQDRLVLGTDDDCVQLRIDLFEEDAMVRRGRPSEPSRGDAGVAGAGGLGGGEEAERRDWAVRRGRSSEARGGAAESVSEAGRGARVAEGAAAAGMGGEAPAAAAELLAVTRLEHVRELEGQIAADPLRASRIYRASKLMAGSLNLQQVCDSACAAIFELLPLATHISLLLDQRPPSPETEAETWETAAKRASLVPFLCVDREGRTLTGERPSRQIVAQVLENKAAVILGESTGINPSQSIIKARIRSVIGAPLAVGERVIGILQVDNRSSSRGLFAQDDLEALVILTRQMALAIENARLFQRVKVAEERLTGENRFLKDSEAQRFRHIIGESEAMAHVFELVDRVVDTSATILIQGETGTGKELIARAIHYRSLRRDQLFVVQNCSALPESLLESELFGHKRGAFTGADSDKKGLFEIAHHGTIFLDEIGETSPALQAKLLRVLQESEIRPLGAMYPKRIDARVVAATNRNLEEEVQKGTFRQDLYYRLNVFPIQLPSLRERRSDIALLAEHFLTKFSREYNRPSAHFSPEALMVMQSYPWPGNIRELENEVQRLVIYGFPGDLVLPEHLAPRMRQAQNLLNRVGPVEGGLKETLEEVERWILLDTLRAFDNNKTRAAKSLKITREGLHKKLSRYGV